MKFFSFIENKKGAIDLLIKIYLWGFVLFSILSITKIALELEALALSSSNLFLNVILYLPVLLANFFVFSPLLLVPIILLVYKKIFNIKIDIFEKNKISFVLEKFLGYGIIILFFIAMPLILIVAYFIMGENALMYYFVIALSSFVPIVFINILVVLYNITTNLKQKERWKKFAINILLYFILILYINRLAVILMRTV